MLEQNQTETTTVKQDIFDLNTLADQIRFVSLNMNEIVNRNQNYRLSEEQREDMLGAAALLLDDLTARLCSLSDYASKHGLS